MPRSVHHWRLGLFVVASASAGFLALLWLAGGRVTPGRGASDARACCAESDL